MRVTTIRMKVVVAMIGCLCVGLGGTLAMTRYSFHRNAAVLAKQSVSEAQTFFAISEAREISKMSAVTAMLNQDPRFGDALAAGDRQRLSELATPLYAQLKNEGITNWLFQTAMPQRRVFLRLHNPAKFGDQLNRYVDRRVAETQTIVTGNDLGKAGFAVRTIAPVYTSRGTAAGFVEFGEELGQFIHTMKSQTGDDYGLLLNKKFVNRQYWTESNALLHRRDNWNDAVKTVVLDKTSNSDAIFKYDSDLEGIPADGTVLERFQEGKSTFVRGIFPVQDAAGENVGAIFVVRDITAFYAEMRHTEMIFTGVIVAALLLGTAMFLWMMTRLIFRRLESIIALATRIVGGEYETEVVVSSDDEVGQFENLFEQFRRVFVDVLQHVPEMVGAGTRE